MKNIFEKYILLPSPHSIIRLNRDKRIDEIIEYANQNLEEAGKALATLGENFEHDLKVEPHIQVDCRKTVTTSRGRKRRGYN